MTPDTFKQIREELGLSQSDVAGALGLKSSRSVRAYEDGEREISGPISKLMHVFCVNPNLIFMEVPGE